MSRRAVDLAHQALSAVEDGLQFAIDATVGNGYDTRFLAEQVGLHGHVWGIDIQAEAIQSAEDRLNAAGLRDRVTLIQGDHAQLETLIPVGRIGGKVDAIMFNLGYLPGGNKSKITHPASTVTALRMALPLLREGGALTLVAYRGHPGGREEAAAVVDLLRSLPEARYAVKWPDPNMANHPNLPVLYVVERALHV